MKLENISEKTRKVKLSESTTVDQYIKWENKKNKEKIADFIYNRFYERYIRPFECAPKDIKNGFSMMANCCLMIEALESFYQGWSNTRDKSELAFCNFFDRVKELSDFHGYSHDFYVNVRCGILHQAETAGGWKIVRRGSLFNPNELTINATKFLNRLNTYLKRYTGDLENASWNDDIWKNLRKKMKTIIKNCERKVGKHVK